MEIRSNAITYDFGNHRKGGFFPVGKKLIGLPPPPTTPVSDFLSSLFKSRTVSTPRRTTSDYILDTIQYVAPGTDVQVIEDFSTGYHSRNGGGDNIVTDGNLPIVQLHNQPKHRSVRDDRINLHSASDIARKLPMNLLVGSVMVALWGLVQGVQLLYRLRNPLDIQEMVSSEPTLQQIVDYLGGEKFIETFESFLPYGVVLFVAMLWFLAWRLLKGSSRARLFTLDLLAFAFLVLLFRTYVWGKHLELITILGQMTILVCAMLSYTSDQARRYTEKAKTLKTPWLSKSDLK